MATEESQKADALRHADFSKRSLADLNPAERAEMNRRYDIFMRHFRDGKIAAAPSGGRARRIRKWRP